MEKKFEEMSIDELKAELKRLKDNLCDIEDTHTFTFGGTSVHIGATQAQNMQEEFDQECREFSEKIAKIEKLLSERQG